MTNKTTTEDAVTDIQESADGESGSGAATVVYPAKRVITMNPANPFAEAVAVRDGRVLAVGTVSEVRSWEKPGERFTIDTRFENKILLPGFIEAHSHVMAGGMWEMPYVGFFDRRDPNGQVWTGCGKFEDVEQRLIEADREMTDRGDDPGEILLAWGLDPIYFEGDRVTRHHLDRVSDTRPIFVYHASGHLATVNTPMLERAQITAEATTPGVSIGPDGHPDGELQEPPAMNLAREAFGKFRSNLAAPGAMQNYAREARNAGHTLVVDLGTSQLIVPEQMERWQASTARDDFPCRAMVALSSMMGGPSNLEDLAAFGETLKDQETDKLRFGVVKLLLDGSIQGFTARISWPYYYDAPEGHPGNGQWLIPPDQFADIFGAFHRAGLTVHTHCNGDQATEVFVSAVEKVLAESPRPDHRHTVQHCQLTTKAQYKRMAALGMCANIFSNHIFYWGDQHRDITVGPERARGMDACATALREGVSFSIHSDAPITPLGHLHTAWCAVNRLTASGQVLGEEECISVMDALHAITLGAAWQLKLDHDMGSIESGKLADFAVLEEDPLEIDPVKLKDIAVWGTVLGGVPQPAGT